MLDELPFSPAEFCGRARLFPLPNLVMFPHVMQPLHIFEPRYRDMLEESLAKDQLIALAQLSSGWEKDYDGRPPMQPIACLCRVATHHKTDKGTYNALLLGVCRVKIQCELPATKLFREAEVALLEDVYPLENKARRPDLQRQLVEAFRHVLPKLSKAQKQIRELLTSEISLGMLTDIIAYTLNFDQKIKEELLAQPLPDLRLATIRVSYESRPRQCQPRLPPGIQHELTIPPPPQPRSSNLNSESRNLNPEPPDLSRMPTQHFRTDQFHGSLALEDDDSPAQETVEGVDLARLSALCAKFCLQSAKIPIAKACAKRRPAWPACMPNCSAACGKMPEFICINSSRKSTTK